MSKCDSVEIKDGKAIIKCGENIKEYALSYNPYPTSSELNTLMKQIEENKQ